MTVRETSDELTLRAEEVGTLKTHIRLRLVCLLSGFVLKASKEKTGERCMRPTKKSAGLWGGVKKPQDAQKANAFWKMKAAKRGGRKYFDHPRVKTTSKEETRQD